VYFAIKNCKPPEKVVDYLDDWLSHGGAFNIKLQRKRLPGEPALSKRDWLLKNKLLPVYFPGKHSQIIFMIDKIAGN
jgi:hypothetical protein